MRGWVRHVKHYIYQQQLQVTSTLKLPASCRGIPRSIDRVQTLFLTRPGTRPTSYS